MKPMCCITWAVSIAWAQAQQSYLSNLPADFQNVSASWAYISSSNPAVAVIPEPFNRTVSQAPWTAQVSDPDLAEANRLLSETDFIAYDERFFDLVGPGARIEQVQELAPGQYHEASCFNPDTKELFFTELGGPSGISGDGFSGAHAWQYLLDTETNELRNITTSPPTFNVHGCVFYNGSYHVVTDGSPSGTATLARIDPVTLERTTLLNNYYQQPFISFNDLDIDPDGNFWLADSISGWNSGVFPKKFYPQTSPTIYFVNGETMRPRVAEVLPLDSNANGVAVSRRTDGSSGLSVYIGQTGLSQALNKILDPSTPLQFNQRGMLAFDAAGTTAASASASASGDSVGEGHGDGDGGGGGGGLLTRRRLFSVALAYQYDGIRASRNGWVFGAGGEGVDVLDPRTGLALGTMHLRAAGARPRTAVNVAFGQHEMWVIGDGGVWHISGIQERLDRGW